MNPDRPGFELEIPLSGLILGLIVLSAAGLLGAVGLGWLSWGRLLLLTLAVLPLLPIVVILALYGLLSWVDRNRVQDRCPVCRYEFGGYRNSTPHCPNCKEPLRFDRDGKLHKISPTHTHPSWSVDIRCAEHPGRPGAFRWRLKLKKL
ncbi:MAG: hypothetical protein ACP5D7_12905 [Limnospira sp.]